MNIKGKFYCGLIAGALTLASPAAATEVLTTSYTAWLGTETGQQEWNFNIPNPTYNTAAGYTLTLNGGNYGTVNVTGPSGAGYSLSKISGYNGSLIGLQSASTSTASMDFTSVAGLTAFGLGLGITGSAQPLTITLSDGEVFTAHPAVNGVVFLGLSSTTPITSFIINTSAGSQVVLTDFFGGTSTEPAPAAEIATALMIGSGLFFLGGCRKVFSNVSAAKV